MQNIKKFVNNHIVIIILLVYVFAFDGKCIIKSISGIPCPGCGLTRASLAFLKLDFKSAFHYHPLFWLATPFLLLVLYGSKPLFNSKKIEVVLYLLVGISFISVYIYRMVNLYPYIEPMDSNTNSLLHLLLRKIVNIKKLTY